MDDPTVDPDVRNDPVPEGPYPEPADEPGEDDPSIVDQPPTTED